jgi:hypothetical protein
LLLKTQLQPKKESHTPDEKPKTTTKAKDEPELDNVKKHESEVDDATAIVKTPIKALDIRCREKGGKMVVVSLDLFF